MIKTNILSYISARWGDITSPKRVPLLDREVSNVLVNEIYPTPISDTQLTTNIVTKIGTKFTYNLQFSKVGRNIHVYGFIKNISGSILNSVEEILEVTNSEFEPYTTYSFICSNLNRNVGLSFNSDALTLVSSIGVGETIIINQTYQSLN